MNFRRLSYFVQVVDSGSISAAARRLNIAQPPLSSQIKQLEDEVGCQLLVREARAVRPTEAGLLLYERAQAILQQSEETLRALEDYRNGAAGTLRVGVVSSVASGGFVRWAAGFHEQYPNVRFAITESNTYSLLDAVRRRRIELAVVRTPYRAGDLASAAVAEQQTFVLGAEKFRACFDGESASPAALCRVPLIVYRRWEAIVREALDVAGQTSNIAFLSDDARTCAALAEAGAGCALIPASALPDPREGMFALRADCEALFSRIDVVWDENAYRSVSALRFVEWIRQNAKLA